MGPQTIHIYIYVFMYVYVHIHICKTHKPYRLVLIKHKPMALWIPDRQQSEHAHM